MITNLVKRAQNIMWNDAGINGDAQRIEQMVWLLFLKVYDAKENDWEFSLDDYQSIIPDELRWENWAKDNKDGSAKTGDELLDFVNNDLFPTLKEIHINADTPMNQRIVRAAFEDNNNYMKDGVLLRQLVNLIDEINFEDYNELHAFGDIYETILKDLQSAGNAGEFYTPRAVTDFIAQITAPKLGEQVADFACGTGGFLTSALNVLEKQVETAEDREIYAKSIYGIEKKALPFLLCATNMLLHDINEPTVFHSNSLERNLRDYTEKDQFDLILMNPPFGGNEKSDIKSNFPAEYQSSETADLFMSVIMTRLKAHGRAAVVLPDGFLFGTDNAKVAIKKRLLKEFNLHTIIRLPHSVFAPYTSITTNILFFDHSVNEKGEPTGTEKTYIYRLDMPEGYKNFSKTRPMLLKHFDEVISWWHNRNVIIENGFEKAQAFTPNELADRQYNLDLCGIPFEEEQIHTPTDLINHYKKDRTVLNQEIDAILQQIMGMIP